MSLGRACLRQLKRSRSLLPEASTGLVVTLRGNTQDVLQKRFFQATPVALGGRKGGASAFTRPASPSKRSRAAAAQKTKAVVKKQVARMKKQQDRAQSKALQALGTDSIIDPEFGAFMEELMAPEEKEDKGLLEIDPVAKERQMVLKEIQEGRPRTVDEYTKLIRVFGAHGRLEDALRVYRELVDREAKVTALTVTAGVCAAAKAGRPEVAEELMREADGLGVTPDHHAWSSLVHAYVKAGQTDQALGAIERMKLAGYPLGLAAATTLLENLRASKRAKRVDDLMDFWIQMRLQGLEPDARAYSVMIRACVDSGEVERALCFLDEMEQVGVVRPTIVNYDLVLRAAAEAPLWFPGYNGYVLEALGRLERSGLAPTDYTYQALLRICARAGNAVLAERYLAKMKEDGLTPSLNIYNELLRAYSMSQSAGAYMGHIPRRKIVKAELGGPEKPLQLPPELHLKDLHKIIKQQRDKADHDSKAGGKQQGGKEENPLAALLALKRAAEGESQQLSAEEKMSRALAKGQQAVMLMQVLPEHDRNSVVLDGVVPRYSDDRRGVLDLVESRRPASWTLEHSQDHNMAAARAVLLELKEAGLEPNQVTINHYLAVYTEALRLKRSLSLAETVFSEHGLQPNQYTFFLLVRMLVRAKRMREALDLIRDMPKKHGLVPDCDTVGTLMDGFARQRELKPALHLLEVMVEDFKYTPKEKHLRMLRSQLEARDLSHPLMPPDPKAWVKKGLELRRQPTTKAERKVLNMVEHFMFK